MFFYNCVKRVLRVVLDSILPLRFVPSMIINKSSLFILEINLSNVNQIQHLRSSAKSAEDKTKKAPPIDDAFILFLSDRIKPVFQDSQLLL